MRNEGTFFWGPGASTGVQSSYAMSLVGLNLNDADNSVAWYFNPPFTGTITRVYFFCRSIVGSPPAYNLGLVTTNSAVTGGPPTTTPYSNAAIQEYVPVAGGNWVTLSTPVTVAAGDVFALRIWPGTTAPTTSHYANIVYEDLFGYGLGGSTYFQTSWSYGAGTPIAALEYSDGRVWGAPWSGVAAGSDTKLTVTVTINSNPDEVGGIFRLPFTARCIGAVLGHGTGNTPWTMTLYDSSIESVSSRYLF